MSRIRVGGQLVGSALRAATPSPHCARVNLLFHNKTARSFTQTCRRLEEDNENKPTATPSSSQASPVAPSPASPTSPTTSPTPPTSSTLSESAGSPALPSLLQPSPLPRTALWHAATSGASPSPAAGGEGRGSSLTELSKMRFGTNFIESALSLSGDPDRQALEKAMNAKSEPFHLHIYSHKKNTHITLTRPNNDVVISVSNGNLGFKHSKRKHYDAAYQLMQHMVSLIEKKGLLPHIPNIEVILKGFGQGREAAAKVLLSPEGVEIKKKIVRVADATTLKFGGTRSRNPRRI